MPRLLLFIAVAVLIASGVPKKANAQDISRNRVFVEVPTSGHLYSINYERRLTAHSSARVGLMLKERANNRMDVATIPIMFNHLGGFPRFEKHRLELGAGLLLGEIPTRLESGAVSRAVRGGVIATIGYRYQPLGDGILFRIGNTFQLYSGIYADQALWQLSLGYTF